MVHLVSDIAVHLAHSASSKQSQIISKCNINEMHGCLLRTLYKIDKMPDFIFMLQFDNLQLCMWTVC